MHELSIAENLVAIATEALRSDSGREGTSAPEVLEVHLRLGRLAGVEKDSLSFCYEIVTRETVLAGSRLVIEDVPAVVYCEACRVEVELPGLQSFRCPRCGRPSGDLRRGRELELVSLHLADRPSAGAEG